MVQSYFRHGPTEAFGLICSASSNSVYDGKFAYVPALEDVLVWDVKKGQMVAMWHEAGHRSEVTSILSSPTRSTFAVGYADGSIRIWDNASGSVITTLNGHKKAVSALAYDETGTRLASGSQDTDLIVWDLVAEVGLFRLRGHRDQITVIRFLSVDSGNLPSNSTSPGTGLLLTASKDTLLKVWDLSTQHCIQTVVAHRSEVWTLAVDTQQGLAFTGSGEGELKAWTLDTAPYEERLKDAAPGEVPKVVLPLSSLPLSSRNRVTQVSFHPSQPFFAVQSHERSVEIFRIRTEEEIRKKQARRKKRAKEKQVEKSGKGRPGGATDDPKEDGVEEDIDLVDRFTPYLVIRATGKVRSFDFGPGDMQQNLKGGTPLFMALASNALEVYSIPPPSKSKSKEDLPEATRVYSVDIPGHRNDVRTLCLSSDDTLLASASNGSLKIWNMKTTSCIRTLDCGYAICSMFLPSDRHVVIGTKSGEMQIFDIASSTLLETIEAHKGTLWSMHLRSDEMALATGSADKDVKFWDVKHRNSEDSVRDGRQVTLVHTKTLKMTDDVLAVRYSPNGKLLAVALLDSTVKVFYEDTLKFFISLYGHKLPVLGMDISHDSKLIVTCSADKNVKIWGLDFGDCHRSIFAHDESVMQVAFEYESHYFWTVGKDRMVKYWDGDKFENIQKLEGHHSEVWALAVSHAGKLVVTGSHDKSIRVWEKLDDELFLEEEREKELEAIYDSGITDTMNREDAAIGSGVDGATMDSAEATAVHKQTTETLMAGERIVEALDLADGERTAIALWEADKAKLSEEDASRLPPPQRNPVLTAYDVEPEGWVLRVVEKIPNAALEDALLVLPFGKVLSLMWYLDEWAKRDWNITLTCRVLFFLLKTHHHQIVANRVMRTALIPLRKHLRSVLAKQKQTIGYNLAALEYIRRQNEASRTAQFYEEEGLDEAKVRAKIADGRKRKRVNIKA
ncbi:WD-repeat-containing protein [Punctularia strigosozonata HHB-11173 SS5]|uniref:WD-repeat-containing protein n=1 Tax=Punctularia strigosozonata (strain HHB-11173) TaxID=741275 RepID=UPI00044186CE|nr:WD-repeat-containing protein [Punctularia strigosozonata HHB-11173 SS5]EIN10729.1 WD-repeat-containing protein [Punctularia strigosozonata HHB-11173 SS5]